MFPGAKHHKDHHQPSSTVINRHQPPLNHYKTTIFLWVSYGFPKVHHHQAPFTTTFSCISCAQPSAPAARLPRGGGGQEHQLQVHRLGELKGSADHRNTVDLYCTAEYNICLFHLRNVFYYQLFSLNVLSYSI